MELTWGGRGEINTKKSDSQQGCNPKSLFVP